jgi:hypothetical protein
MSEAKPVKCQKCGKPVGYVSVVTNGLLNFRQPVKNVKVVAICMECHGRTSFYRSPLGEKGTGPLF